MSSFTRYSGVIVYVEFIEDSIPKIFDLSYLKNVDIFETVHVRPETSNNPTHSFSAPNNVLSSKVWSENYHIISQDFTSIFVC